MLPYRYIGMIVFLHLLTTIGNAQSFFHKYVLAGKAQGTTYQILYYSAGNPISRTGVDSILDVMDACFSLYNDGSLIMDFNHSMSGIRLQQDFAKVMEQCFAVYLETSSVADPTVYPLVQLWAGSDMRLSSRAVKRRVQKVLGCVGLGQVMIRNDSLIKKRPCIQLDLNGTAQGYTVDLIAAYLEKNGIDNYLVELGGEIRCKGRKQPTGERFTIALEQPSEGPWTSGMAYKSFHLENGAVTTSGNYRKYMESGGRNRGHIIDANTGYPVHNELISVTLFAESALVADAYDHAVFSMGLQRGSAFVDAHPFLKAIFIYKDARGNILTKYSKGLDLFNNLSNQEYNAQ